MGERVSVSIYPCFISKTFQQIIYSDPFMENTIQFSAVFSCDQPYEYGISFPHFRDCVCFHHQQLCSGCV
jgi:hypothetical protein